MITISLTLIDKTRTKERPDKWTATTTTDGKSFSATSRMNPCSDLARALVAANIPDQPVQLWNDNLNHWALRWKSLHAMAQWMIIDPPSSYLHRVKYKPPPENWAKTE
jgi:hypothetical protein